MRKYMLAFFITILILLVAWNIDDSAEDPKIAFNSNVKRSGSSQAGIPQKMGPPVGIVNAYSLKVRNEPNGVLIKRLPKGAEVTILAEENEFYRISWQKEDDTAEGYVRKEYIDIEESSGIEIMQKAIKEIIPSVEEPTTEFALAEEQEEVIDYTQSNTEIFYQTAEEDYGLSHKQVQSWFDIVTEDDVFKGGIREIRDLIFDDIDGNGMTDMVIMVQEPEMEYIPGTGALYFYMNEEEPYCFMDEDFPFFRPADICYADLNGDGNVEIAFALMGTGNGGSGEWHKAVLSYTGSTMERLEFPSDLDRNYDEGLEIDVIMESEPDTYTACCSYLDENTTFQAANGWDGDTQKAYLAEAPKGVGTNIRGYYDLQIVAWKGRDALQVREYLCGEGGNAHCVGWAYFILIWDERGNGSVADWWVEGNLGGSGLVFYSYVVDD